MKYVILSFDDGREDTYSNAVPILDKYNIKATINITTDYVLNEKNYKFASCSGVAMKIEDIKECMSKGYEIANHSHTHSNEVEDIKKSIETMSEWGIDTYRIGFASPHSFVCKENVGTIQPLIKNSEIGYIRSGIQVRRESCVYKTLYILQELIHSNKLFYFLNKKNIVKVDNLPEILLGVSVKAGTKIEQIEYLLKKLKDDECVILTFHSILDDNQNEYKIGNWYWDVEKFDSLCRYIANSNDMKTIRTKDLVSI